MEVVPGNGDGPVPSFHHARFEALFDRFYERLRSRCYQLTGDWYVGEDLAQETLLRAYARIDTLREETEWPWLKTVASRLAIDTGRRRGREVPVVADRFPDQAQAAVDVAEETEHLGRALSLLTPRHRVALGLRYLEDWDPDEIAAYLGLSGQALKQLLFRARRRLRSEYRRLSQGVSAIPALVALRSVARAFGHRPVRVATGGFRRASRAAFLQAVTATSVGVLVLAGMGGAPGGRVPGAPPMVQAGPGATHAAPVELDRVRLTAEDVWRAPSPPSQRARAHGRAGCDLRDSCLARSLGSNLFAPAGITLPQAPAAPAIGDVPGGVAAAIQDEATSTGAAVLQCVEELLQGGLGSLCT
jgi:RNA polymerase sigma-70 factor (ECF subfamily)